MTFVYDDIVHALQITMNSIDRYVKFAQCLTTGKSRGAFCNIRMAQ